jgi:hypothetical protein
MFKQMQKVLAGVAVLAAVAVGASAVAGAASNGHSAAPQRNSAHPPALRGGHGPGETLLTGDTAAKVKKAAQDKVPGGTILRVETDSAGSPYEAHVRKSNGSEVVVKVDKAFQATDVQNGPGGPPRGGPGAGGPAGPPPTSSY